MGNDEKLVQIANVPRWMSDMAKAKLEAHGIEAVFIDESQPVEGALGSEGVRIKVAPSDAETATPLIEDLPL